MRTSTTARRWERGILALVLATAVALTAVARTDAEAVDGPVDVVYIATGNNFADALVASVAAAMNGAPLLTVKSPGVFGDEIPQVTKDKLTDLKPARMVVLGGPAAVSDKVFNELKVYSPDVTRVAGDDRFETAAVIADLVPEAVKRAFFADKAGDADTLDGLDSAAFALSDKSCPSGQVVKGTNASGNPICTPDNNNGGDADTLDGLDSTDFFQADATAVNSANWRPFGSATVTMGSFGSWTVSGGNDVVEFPSLPSSVGGTDMSLASLELCYDAAANTTTLTQFGLIVDPGPTNGAAFIDTTDRTDAGCATFALTPPVKIDSIDLVAGFASHTNSSGDLIVWNMAYTLVPSTDAHVAAAAHPMGAAESSVFGS